MPNSTGFWIEHDSGPELIGGKYNMLTEKMFDEIKKMASDGHTVQIRMENGNVIVSTLKEDICMTTPLNGD